MAVSSPHRFSLNDLAPDRKRVSSRDAMAQLRARGLDDVGSKDLEVYRLVMSPADFKRLCNRLDQALVDHHKNANQAAWPNAELPFGEDLQEVVEVEVERRRRWVDRPNGEPLPLSWQVETECRLPGRLRLIEGREFSAVGVRGRLRFRYAVRTDEGEFWIEAFDRDGGFRSLRPERVKRVHAKSTLHPRLTSSPKRARGARKEAR